MPWTSSATSDPTRCPISKLDFTSDGLSCVCKSCNCAVSPSYFLPSSKSPLINNPNTAFHSVDPSAWYDDAASEGYNMCVACHAVKKSRTLPLVTLGIIFYLSWSLFVGLQSSERQRVDTESASTILLSIGIFVGIVNTIILKRSMTWLWQFRHGVAKIIEGELTESSRGEGGIEAQVQLVNKV
ncbi:hypothetical protein TrST_g5245 [Triparma strigata]|uniref:Uncharacterized protein n=1 Tax=Triparma strigata TaxID=1606541 RepID=A0A9W6ZQA4_9STRA|nr:hypothetical protein TrST_g5245 [Triparma strigata]